MTRTTKLAVVAVALVAAVACAASTTQARPIEQQALAVIKSVDALYYSTLQAVGDLHRVHKLNDSTYARVLATADVVRVAREAVVQALLDYLSVPATSDGTSAARRALDVAVARLEGAVVQLRAEAPAQ